MVIELLEKQEEQLLEQKIIKTKYWELPEDSLEGWKPFVAVIDYTWFLGPQFIGSGRGLSLDKDLMGGIHGARGAGKSELLSFLCAKKLRSGKPVWTNYPISFFVREEDGTLTYYESQPLDFDKFYTFSREVRNGAVGITELQYYVEARTSGREQNRIAGYQIMQIRKTALSFFYDVQDRGWVDKRFGWSNDFDIECSDIAKMSYKRASVANFPYQVKDEYGRLRGGAYVRLTLEDTSGVLTGSPFHKSFRELGPYQFKGWHMWEIYPTHFIVDVYDAVHSLKKNKGREDEKDQLFKALQEGINDFLEEGELEVVADKLWERTTEKLGREFSHQTAGQMLREVGVTGRQLGTKINKGKIAYNIGELLEKK